MKSPLIEIGTGWNSLKNEMNDVKLQTNMELQPSHTAAFIGEFYQTVGVHKKTLLLTIRNNRY